MANYYGYTRTNHFKIKEDKEKAFNDLCAGLCGEDYVHYDVEKRDGGVYAMIWAETSLMWRANSDDEDDNIDYFFDTMRTIVADDDAMLWTEIGREKMRYLTAYTVIVTSDEVTCVNLEDKAFDKAREVLNNPNWRTVNCY